ncbi:energy transducer TonB [Desulfoglaeba alkanexedens]|jgi:protein TonB|uniref:Energy transducer TonB n=1 Tax=Desulfoglaeba alkanexedens ALDC TaxID=980445 RepID=A0A4P8L3W3_9BACT|nr:energy transducer TonB [Desulfoglaeba alkanexedens]QCQ22579.1 energy transducer TonB [Desulfoglaeba alkanexedens ALDC]
MDARTFRRAWIAVSGALLVNAFLLAMLPWPVRQKCVKPDLEVVMPVHLVQIRHTKPAPAGPEEPPPEQKEAPKAPEEIPAALPDVSIRRPVPDTSRMSLEVPSLNFEINANLAGGVAVAPPPAAVGPTVFASAAAKAIWDQGEVDQVPVPVSQVKPLYPYRARRLQLDGKVRVRFLVKEDGQVSGLEIVESVPPGVFDDSVRSALAKWRFSPGKVNGKPVCTRVATTIEFKFEDE